MSVNYYGIFITLAPGILFENKTWKILKDISLLKWKYIQNINVLVRDKCLLNLYSYSDANNTQKNNTQHNDIQQDYTQLKDVMHSDTQLKDIKHSDTQDYDAKHKDS